MQKSTQNTHSRFWRRLAAAALAVPVAVVFAAPGVGAVEADPVAGDGDEQLPGLPVPGLPGDGDGGDNDLVGQLGECVAALVETVVGALSSAGGDLPAPAGEADEQLPATDGLQPCLELLSALGLPLDLPDLPVPLPLDEPAAED